MAVYTGKPPYFAGMCAGARGIARHTQPDADALLVWYRTAGRTGANAVRLHLARRAIAADWQCFPHQAVVVIEDAMVLVLRRHAPAASVSAQSVAMRKAEFLVLRCQASTWLRASIMEAEWRYGCAC
ncbi:MAG: hypothetical protein ACOH1V_03095 [Stenotrophomonas sp.]